MAHANRSASIAPAVIAFCSGRHAMMRGALDRPRAISARLSGKDLAGCAKGPIDRIGRFVIGRLDQAS
ncbi:hypothetical protein WHZ77_11375 [Bradyrhizobium sp. A5]|uniref:hypothetical protein n=1 Tax=Bradyrhizobium sp. A5 TaxID=3133696 RepID=UPI00324831C2